MSGCHSSVEIALKWSFLVLISSWIIFQENETETIFLDSKLFLFIEHGGIIMKELKDLVEMGWLFVIDVAIAIAGYVNWCNQFICNITQIERN